MSFLHALEGFSRALVSDADFDVGGRERAREFQTMAGQLATAAAAEGLNGLSQIWRTLERSFASLHSGAGEGLGGAVLGAWRRIASLVRAGGEGVNEEVRDLLAPLPELMAASVGRDFEATEALIAALHAVPFLDGDLAEVDAALRSDVRHLAPTRAPRIVPRELMGADTSEILMSAKQFVELARAGGDTSSSNFDDFASPIKVESFAADTTESNKSFAQDSLPNFSAGGHSAPEQSHESAVPLLVPEIPALAWQSTSSTRSEDRVQRTDDRGQKTEDKEAPAVDDFALDVPAQECGLDLFDSAPPSLSAEAQAQDETFISPLPLNQKSELFAEAPLPTGAVVSPDYGNLFDSLDQVKAKAPAPAAVPDIAFDALPESSVAEAPAKTDELAFDNFPDQVRAELPAPPVAAEFAFDALPEPSVAKTPAKADELAFDDMALPVPNDTLFDEPVPEAAESMMLDDLVAGEPSASQSANSDDLFMPDNAVEGNSAGLLKGIRDSSRKSPTR
jgi:hypothetical protein